MAPFGRAQERAAREGGGEVLIRRARASDAAKIAAVLRSSFREYQALYTEKALSATTPSSEQVRVRLQEGPIWIAEQNGIIIGTTSAVARADSLYVRGMAVKPAARGQRIGQLVLQEAEKFAVAGGFRRLVLSTTPFLHHAVRLYEHSGFIRTDEGPHDLFGTPLFTMEKPLVGPQLMSKHDGLGEGKQLPKHFTVDGGVRRLPGPSGERSLAIFEHRDLLLKFYAPRGADPQKPHTRDELYVVARGCGEFELEGHCQPFGCGDVLFAPAGAQHRFLKFTQDFAVWVIFYGPEQKSGAWI
jgi:GNAT superfamily N-acetyltransferase/mannose-6-phosphate isomerase-like protein (cupin superfamily)